MKPPALSFSGREKALFLFPGEVPQMVEFFEEELFLQGTFSVHWLIWIQLLVFLLLLLLLPLLLYSSPSDDVIIATSVETPLRSSPATCTTTTTAASTSSSRQRQKKKLEEEDSKLDRRRGGFDGDDSSGPTEVTHPCHIVRLARMAFLKCFGLDPPKDNPTCRELPPRR